MANLVRKADLVQGGRYFEECTMGTEAMEMTIKKKTDEIITLEYKKPLPISGGRKLKLSAKRFMRDQDFRYWDAEPTDEEREFTKWTKDYGEA